MKDIQAVLKVSTFITILCSTPFIVVYSVSGSVLLRLQMTGRYYTERFFSYFCYKTGI
jgi:hypothetical protein